MKTFKLSDGRIVTEDDFLREPRLRRLVVEEIEAPAPKAKASKET